MTILFLFPLLFVPSAIADPTDGYKEVEYCSGDGGTVYLQKKEQSNSKKWGVYSCSDISCSWADKAVSYDTAVDKYNEKSSKLPCARGTLSIDN